MVSGNRGFANNIRFSYDNNTDTLYLFFGPQENSVSRDIGNGVLIAYNNDNQMPVAAVIHDFDSRVHKMAMSDIFELPVRINTAIA